MSKVVLITAEDIAPPDLVRLLHHEGGNDDDGGADVEHGHGDVVGRRQGDGDTSLTRHVGHVKVSVLVRAEFHLVVQDGDGQHDDHLSRHGVHATEHFVLGPQLRHLAVLGLALHELGREHERREEEYAQHRRVRHSDARGLQDLLRAQVRVAGEPVACLVNHQRGVDNEVLHAQTNLILQRRAHLGHRLLCGHWRWARGGLQVLVLVAGAGRRLVDEVFGCAPST